MKPILFNTEMVKAVLDGRKTQTRRVIKSNLHWYIGQGFPLKNPDGQVGDKLWVRETFCIDDQDMIFFKADETFKPIELKWKPSIFMPRKASRITLEITDIRVEGIQDISQADIVKEGIKITDEPKRTLYLMNDFFQLWESINKKRGYGWDVNPYVWVVEFKLLENENE